LDRARAQAREPRREIDGVARLELLEAAVDEREQSVRIAHLVRRALERADRFGALAQRPVHARELEPHLRGILAHATSARISSGVKRNSSARPISRSTTNDSAPSAPFLSTASARR